MTKRVLLIIVLGALAAGVATSSAAEKHRRCATSGRTIAKNHLIRVFRVGLSNEYSAYACVLPRGRVRHLGDYQDFGGGEWDGVYDFVIAGKFVAYEDALCDHTSCGGSIKSFNVSSRQMLHRARIPVGYGRERILVVNARGSVAWSRQNTIWKCDAPKCVLLERNNAINPASLILRHGHTLRWKHDDGTAQTATLR